MMTEDEARMIGKAIHEAAEMVALPIECEMERRAICLKLAIGTWNVAHYAFADGPTSADIAALVVDAARVYEAYVTGEEP